MRRHILLLLALAIGCQPDTSPSRSGKTTSPPTSAKIRGISLTIDRAYLKQVVDQAPALVIQFKGTNISGGREEFRLADVFGSKMEDEHGHPFLSAEEWAGKVTLAWPLAQGESMPGYTYFSPAQLDKGERLILTLPDGQTLGIEQKQVAR
jgi:hypothetical protein